MKNVETTQDTSNGNKNKGQHEAEITNNDDDANPSLNDKDQSGVSNESNETTSDPTSEGQIIRQHKFYIHSSWLAVQSSYFRSLFFGGIKESISPKEVHVQISESEEQAHLMLLEAIYKMDILDNANVDELLEVLRLAQKYDVKFVFKKCKYCLQVMVDSIEKIMCFIKVENSIKDVEDLETMLQFNLAKEFSPLDKTWQTKRFEELSEATLKYLLSSDELVAASENTVFHALMHWIKKRGIDKVLESTELPSLLSVVRFELIPIDYLYNIVQYNALAKKFPDFNDHYVRGISYHALSDIVKPRLPYQPVKRKSFIDFCRWMITKPFIPYTWVVTTDELDKQTQSGKQLQSHQFWYCGYRMGLVISHVKILNLGETKAMFNATLSLAVTNLTEQSEVMIRWQAASKSFTSTPVEKTSTFNKKAHVSSVDISYEMDVKHGKSSGNVAGTKPPGFTISTSPSKPSGGLFFGSLQSSVTTSTGKATPPLFMSSTPPSKPSSGFTFGSLQSNVTTSSGTATTPLFMSSASPSKPSGGITFGSLQSSVTTIARTATTPLSTFSTPPSKPSGKFSLGPRQSSVTTSTGTATPLFMSSTPPSKPSGKFSFGPPQSSVTTSTGTATTSAFTFIPNPTCLSIDMKISLVQSEGQPRTQGFSFGAPTSLKV